MPLLRAMAVISRSSKLTSLKNGRPRVDDKANVVGNKGSDLNGSMKSSESRSNVVGNKCSDLNGSMKSSESRRSNVVGNNCSDLNGSMKSSESRRSTKRMPEDSSKSSRNKIQRVAHNIPKSPLVTNFLNVTNESSKNSKLLSGKQGCPVSKKCWERVDKTNLTGNKGKAKESLESCREKILITTNPSHVNVEATKDGINVQASLKKPIDSEGCAILDGLMSPKRALRASMLKCRYADLIYKSKHYSIAEHDQKHDSQWKKREEKILKNEKANFLAEYEAMVVSQNLQRQKDREAARKALELMKETIVIYDSEALTRDLESFGLVINQEGYLEDIY